MTETVIKENYATAEDKRDEVLNYLQNAVVDEDEFFRYRISERFNAIMRSLFNTHKTDTLSPEHTEAIEGMKSMIQGYVEDKKTDGAVKAKYIALCKQLGLNPTHLTEEEQQAMMRALEKSSHIKAGRGGHRKKK